MSTGLLVSVVAILGALVLAWRGLRSRSLPPGTWWKMAAIWIVIIVGLVLVIQIVGLGIEQ